MESAASVLTEPGLQQLERIFAESQKIDLLVPLVWEHRETALRRLSSVAIFMRMCHVAERGDAYLHELRSWLMDEATDPVSFSHLPFLRAPVGIRDERLLDLFLFKYKGWDCSSSQKFAESARALGGRCDIPQPLAMFLYERRAGRDLDFSSWLRDVKSAQVFNHVVKDKGLAKVLLPKAGRERIFLKRFYKAAMLANHVDAAQTKLFFEELDTSRGLLLCTFHGAFSYILNVAFDKFMPGHYVIRAERRVESGDAGAPNGNRGTAFRALKALMQKKAVLMAPDGPHFSDGSAAEIKVFDSPFRISAGGAFLAYEAGSDTGWCSVIRKNERFAPVYVPGPSRSPGETFKQFRDRWLSFYAEQIEIALSSDPKNLDLRSSKWSSFGSNSAE